MLYSKQIKLIHGTSSLSPSKTYFKVNKGVISRIWVTFPSGCVGLVKMRMYHEGHPFIPVNQENYIRGNGYTFEFPVMYEIISEPQLITIEAWNEDDTYDHTIDILILILPKSAVYPTGATEGILESLKSLVLHPILIQEVQGGEIIT